jgi:FkbM family methyltransferase
LKKLRKLILEHSYLLRPRVYSYFFKISNLYLKYPVRLKVVNNQILITDRHSEFAIFNSRPRRISRYGVGVKQLCESLLEGYCLDGLDLPDNANIIDIGANVGELSYSLIKKNPNVKLISIEPDPSDFKDLARNIGAKHLSINRAVADFSGELLIYLNNEYGDTGVFPTDTSASRFKTRCSTLDDIYAEYCFEEKIFLIKCEAEGFEPEVLSGASKTLKNTLYVSCDTGPERMGQSTFDEVQALLQKSNFKLIRSIRNRHLFLNLQM